MRYIITKLFFAMILFIGVQSINAQICTGSYSNGCAGDYMAELTITTAGGKSLTRTGMTCASAGTLNAGAPLDVVFGEKITVYCKNNPTYSEKYALWIDADRDNSFNGTTECVAGTSGPLGTLGANGTVTANMNVPCGTNPGKSTMRLRVTYGTYTNSQGCGSISTWGAVYDIEINLISAGTPVANFSIPPAPNYVKQQQRFSASGNAAFNYTWTFQTPTSVIQSTGQKGIATWASASCYDVKLKVDFCGLGDSIIKKICLVAPTAVPVADFIASNNFPEKDVDVVVLTPLSSNGAYSHKWEITSPTGVVYTPTTTGAYSFVPDEPGKWSVCLVSSNDIGPSSKFCKPKYIDCQPTSVYYVGFGPTAASNKKGVIYDHAGPTANYGVNRKTNTDYLKILPCGAKKITLKLSTIKLADVNDKIYIYDADQAIASKLLVPTDGINSTNQANWINKNIVGTSGSMYITFESNGAGVDEGFIGSWDSELDNPVKPTTSFTTKSTTVGTGALIDLIDNSTNVQGLATHQWFVDWTPESTNKDYLNKVFFTTGTYDVCKATYTCNGGDTACKKITVITPNSPVDLDYVADILRPALGQTVSFTSTSVMASNFDWDIFPTTFSYVNGTSRSSKNPQIKFNAGGCYTFTVKAWNFDGGRTATENTVIKNKYVCAVNPCVPIVDLLSTDVGINSVALKNGSTLLLNNASSSGTTAYTDYTTTIPPATLNFGGTYNLEIGRTTNSNPINYKVWIDFNIDGNFDASEQVLSSGQITGLSTTGNFTVPPLSSSFEGNTRMRVGASYGNFSNTPCGVNAVGEFEDYPIILANDNAIPVITLVGSDTVRVERTATVTGCFDVNKAGSFSCMDPVEGDLTNKVQVSTDLDCTLPGIYTAVYTCTDASGNRAVAKVRTIIVVLDKTAPTLTINGANPVTVEQCTPYIDGGAIAIDIVDGDLTTAILKSGVVDENTVGDYIITYSVSDAQGNTVSKTRTVKVRDTKKPLIKLKNAVIVNNDIVKIQIFSPFIDEVFADDGACNGIIPMQKIPGNFGVVNNQVRGTYPQEYRCTDASGNVSDQNKFIIYYNVDDYIAPDINLNTADIVFHDVNTPYISRNVTISDNYYPTANLVVVKSGTGVNPYKLGTYTETYTCNDPSGNSTVKTRKVIVVDRIAPELLAPPVSACVGKPFWAYNGLTVKDNYYAPDSLMPRIEILSYNVNIYQSGIYYINYKISDPSGNVGELVTRTVYVDYEPNCQNTISAKSFDINKAISVSPNPSAGKINIRFSMINTAPIAVEVFNSMGTKVYTNANIGEGIGSNSIDLTGVAAGVYHIRFTNNGQAVSKQIVINK